MTQPSEAELDRVLAAYAAPPPSRDFAARVAAEATRPGRTPARAVRWSRAARRPWTRRGYIVGILAINLLAASALAAIFGGHALVSKISTIAHNLLAPTHVARSSPPPGHVARKIAPAPLLPSRDAPPPPPAAAPIPAPEVAVTEPLSHPLPRPVALMARRAGERAWPVRAAIVAQRNRAAHADLAVRRAERLRERAYRKDGEPRGMAGLSPAPPARLSMALARAERGQRPAAADARAGPGFGRADGREKLFAERPQGSLESGRAIEGAPRWQRENPGWRRGEMRRGEMRRVGMRRGGRRRL